MARRKRIDGPVFPLLLTAQRKVCLSHCRTVRLIRSSSVPDASLNRYCHQLYPNSTRRLPLHAFPSLQRDRRDCRKDTCPRLATAQRVATLSLWRVCVWLCSGGEAEAAADALCSGTAGQLAGAPLPGQLSSAHCIASHRFASLRDALIAFG